MWIKIITSVVTTAAITAGATYYVTTNIVSEMQYEFATMPGICASMAPTKRLVLEREPERGW